MKLPNIYDVKNYNDWFVLDYDAKDKRLQMRIFSNNEIKNTSYLQWEMDGPDYIVHIKT